MGTYPSQGQETGVHLYKIEMCFSAPGAKVNLRPCNVPSLHGPLLEMKVREMKVVLFFVFILSSIDSLYPSERLHHERCRTEYW